MIPRMVVVLVLAVAGWSPPDSSAPVGARIAESQVTLEAQRVAFQGSVIDRRTDPPRLTVVTAAHGLFPLGEGTPIVVRPVAGEVALRGVVESAVPNPGYKPLRTRDPRSALKYQGAIGSDNSVVTLRLTLSARERPVFQALQAVPVTARPVPDRARVGVLTVHVVDRKGVEHVVKAGNSMNPKWLAWGPRYQPRPGDSGAGVFLVVDPSAPDRRSDAQATPHVLLIGNVVASDDAGGIAALFSQAEFPALVLTREPGDDRRGR
jgi:hypothetical protein